MKTEHTPGPWECIDANQWHGFYITSPWGGTVCDLYTMSNPSAASIRNGGDSFPIAHQEGYDRANAYMIAAAPEVVEAGARLLAVFDQQRMTVAERIIVGVSDAGLRTEGNAAIEALRAAIAKALTPP